MAQGRAPWHPGLLAGLGAFLVFIVSPVLPFLGVVFTLLGVACLALLSGDARRRGPAAGRRATLGLVLLALGFLTLFATNVLGASLLQGGDLEAWRRTFWLYAAGEVAVAAGFHLGPLHLASDRSRTLLGVALGAAVATSAIASWQAQGAAATMAADLAAQGIAAGGEGYRAWLPGAVAAFAEATAGANQAKAVAFILFAWAYAGIAGRLRAEARPKDPWALK